MTRTHTEQMILFYTCIIHYILALIYKCKHKNKQCKLKINHTLNIVHQQYLVSIHQKLWKTSKKIEEYRSSKGIEPKETRTMKHEIFRSPLHNQKHWNSLMHNISQSRTKSRGKLQLVMCCALYYQSYRPRVVILSYNSI